MAVYILTRIMPTEPELLVGVVNGESCSDWQGKSFYWSMNEEEVATVIIILIYLLIFQIVIIYNVYYYVDNKENKSQMMIQQ